MKRKRRANASNKAGAIRIDGDTGTPQLRNHCKVVFEARKRTSTGQATVVGARNVDAAAPIERYFRRGELDEDPVRNDRLFRAAERLREEYVRSNLEPIRESKFMIAMHSGVPDKWANIRLDAFRAYSRAIKAINRECQPIASFVVVHEEGHVMDWAKLKGIKERGAIKFLRLGLTELAVHYKLLKKSDGRRAIKEPARA